MSGYATVDDVEAGFRTLTETEKTKCEKLIEEAAVIIDAYSRSANNDRKKVVICRMVRRAVGDADTKMYPLGATQGTASALGYSQSWTMGTGSSGELYLSKLDKKLLGIGDYIGAYNPLNDLAEAIDD